MKYPDINPDNIRIDLFLDSDSFHNCIPHFSSERSNYCNNNLLIVDLKQLYRIMKIYYLTALWDSQGKINLRYGMSRVKKQLSGKWYINVVLSTNVCT